MPRSRKKNGNAKNVTSSTAPIPLLDSIRSQMQTTCEENDDHESDIDNNKVSTDGWQCDFDDWSGKKVSNSETDAFPKTIRSLERKHEQSKNKLFQRPQNATDINENSVDSKAHIDDRTKKSSTNDIIDVLKLTSIVTDLITGKHDELAYREFLSILQHFSVHESRDDHLEETTYHLIQAAISFIRSNEERFDPNQLQECYRKRYMMKMNASQ